MQENLIRFHHDFVSANPNCVFKIHEILFWQDIVGPVSWTWCLSHVSVEKCRNTYRRALAEAKPDSSADNEGEGCNPAGTSEEIEMATEWVLTEG